MQYQINNEFGYSEDYDYLDSLIERVLTREKATDSVFSIIFVDNEKIHELNKQFRGVDRPTDVISFALEDAEEEFLSTIRVLGDIYISIPKVQEQAKEYGHSEKRELAFLVVHGLLHLLGYDHQTEEEEKVMFQIQEEMLNEEGISR